MPDHIASIARLLGNSYAHVQHGMDKAVEWGFMQMRTAAETKKSSKKPEREPRTAGERALKIGKVALQFVGTAGDAYFKKYEELKRGKR